MTVFKDREKKQEIEKKILAALDSGKLSPTQDEHVSDNRLIGLCQAI